MPIERVLPIAVCDLCAAREQFVEAELDDDEDVEIHGLPLGWILSSHTRRTKNPGFAAALAHVEARVDASYQSALEQAKIAKVKLSAEDKEELRTQVEEQIMDAFDVPAEIEQTLESVLCIKCAGALQSRMCADDWPAEED